MIETIIETIEYRGGRIEVYPDDCEGNDPRGWANIGKMLCGHREYNLGDEQISRDGLPEFGVDPTCWHCGEPIREDAAGFESTVWVHALPNEATEECDEYLATDPPDKCGPDDDWWPDMETWLVAEHDMVPGSPILPLGLYDHSGITMYVGGTHPFDSAGWDSGQVGVIFATNAGVAECGTPPELFEEVLRGEVEVYDDFLTGSVYGYLAYAPDGEMVGSCWGFYPDHPDSHAGKSWFEAELGYMLGEARGEIDDWWDDLNERTGGRALMMMGASR